MTTTTPQLIGAIVSSDPLKSIALFSSPSGEVLHLKLGETFGEWTIASIEYRAVRLCNYEECQLFRPGEHGEQEIVVVEEVAEYTPQRLVELKISRESRNEIIEQELIRILSKASSTYDPTDGVSGVHLEHVSKVSLHNTFGLSDGDIITAVDGIPVSSLHEALMRLRALEESDRFQFTVMRGSSARVYDVEILDM